MNFHCRAQCDPLGPVLNEKSERNAAKAMERITNGQGNPLSPYPVNQSWGLHGTTLLRGREKACKTSARTSPQWSR
jgi:hypothetical protein